MFELWLKIKIQLFKKNWLFAPCFVLYIVNIKKLIVLKHDAVINYIWYTISIKNISCGK